MTKDEALKLALEALEGVLDDSPKVLDASISGGLYEVVQCRDAITAIKEALAQPEQTNTRPYYTIDELNAWADEKEKQAWRNAAIRIGEELSSDGPDGYYEMDAWKWLDWAMEQEPRGKNSLAQPEQEPVGEGWKLVPVEPTEDMWEAVNKLDDEMAAGSYDGKGCSIEQAWNCLLNAAPTPPAQRKPLTNEEIEVLLSEYEQPYAWFQFARAIEAAHGITQEKYTYGTPLMDAIKGKP